MISMSLPTSSFFFVEVHVGFVRREVDVGLHNTIRLRERPAYHGAAAGAMHACDSQRDMSGAITACTSLLTRLHTRNAKLHVFSGVFCFHNSTYYWI
jgi:hypothetical protein